MPDPHIDIARAYELPAHRGNDYRVLVDRLWPRGIRKDAVELDEWAKDVAPSSQLRRWYGHDPDRFEEFARRYRAELGVAPGADALSRLRELGRKKRVVLITATRDVEHSGAAVLAAALRSGGIRERG